jgi:adenylosuccinate lyase
VQTVMRRYGVEDAYEQLKELTRGEAINQEILQQFIGGIDLPDEARTTLLALTPESYTGLAEALAGQLKERIEKTSK